MSPFASEPTNPAELVPRRFTGQEAQEFDLPTAAAWIAADRHQSAGQPRAYFFGRDIIERILRQPGCMGLRVYYALDHGQRHLLLVGADAHQNDQLPDTGQGIIAEMAVPCPNQCSAPNALNAD